MQEGVQDTWEQPLQLQDPSTASPQPQVPSLFLELLCLTPTVPGKE